jgi:DNA-binding transcriptional regulator PaaX
MDETRYVGGKVAKVATAHTNAKLQNESKKPTMTINEVANKYNTLLAEAKDLKGKNEEYKEALKKFRTMLAETVVFNSNLTYVTKLFMEQSTTKGYIKRLLMNCLLESQ